MDGDSNKLLDNIGGLNYQITGSGANKCKFIQIENLEILLVGIILLYGFDSTQATSLTE